MHSFSNYYYYYFLQTFFPLNNNYAFLIEIENIDGQMQREEIEASFMIASFCSNIIQVIIISCSKPCRMHVCSHWLYCCSKNCDALYKGLKAFNNPKNYKRKKVQWLGQGKKRALLTSRHLRDELNITPLKAAVWEASEKGATHSSLFKPSCNKH